ncbi:MAG: hypothetical protein R3C01_04895 [Planctomycetaceae bacterium]
MSSPFSLFRKHQGILMVVLIGMAMLSFVVLGMVQQASDFSQMPPIAVIAFIGFAVGTLAWVYGLSTNQSGQYGTIGLVAGLAIGMVLTLTSPKSVAFQYEGGSLSQDEFEQARAHRLIANSFLQAAIVESNEENEFLKDPRFARFAGQFISRGLFQYTSVDGSDQEVMISELLRKEADRLGIQVSDEAAVAHISKVTDGKLTPKQFEDILKGMRNPNGKELTERRLLDAIASELKAAEAAEVLYFHSKPAAPFGDNSHLTRMAGPIALPPQALWEITKKLEVWQRAEIAKVPSSLFLDEKATPSEEELSALFQDCRNNPPNVSADGRVFVEGRAGFFQPPRVQMAYLEADLELIHAKVSASIKDADIKARFEAERAKAPATGPLIPNLGLPGSEFNPGAFDSMIPPALPSPPVKAGDGSTPAEGDTKPDGNTSTSPSTETPKSETPAAEAPKPETPVTETPATETPKTELPKTESPTTEEAPVSESPAGDATSSADCLPGDDLSGTVQVVALFDDAAEESPAPAASDAPTAEAPKSETPAETTPPPAATETPPAATTSATESAPTTESAPAAGEQPSQKLPAIIPGAPGEELLPPRPTTGAKLLDENEKLRLRGVLMQERTEAELNRLMRDAQFFVEKLGSAVTIPEGNDGRITKAEAINKIVEYAGQNGLIYRETGLLSQTELLEDSDHAQVTSIMNYRQNPNTEQFEQYTPASEMAQSAPTDIFRTTVVTDPQSQNQFLYWKLDHVEAHAPESMEDERVRKEVIVAWRKIQASKKAEERAKTIAQFARDSGKPLPEALAEVRVVDDKDSPFLTVAETSQFSWMRATDQGPRVWQPSAIQAANEQVGDDFMKVVFADELQAGNVVVAPDVDRTNYYVVRIIERKPDTPEDLEIVRNNYLAGKDSNAVRSLMGQTIGRSEGPWVSDLLAKYKVDEL